MSSLPAKHLRAVLTGDVVASSQLPAEQRRLLPAILKGAAKDLERAFPKAVAGPLAVFRGDSWQLIVSEPALSLQAGLLFRSGVIAASGAGLRLDTRMAIAVDTIDFMPSGRVSEGDGPAYRASGAALDDLGTGVRMCFVAPGAPDLWKATIGLLDAIIQDWTVLQALAVKGRLQGRTQAEIAARWPERITQQTVARHLARAHWPVVEDMLPRFANSLRTL
jgi:hypothetical protein